MRLLQRCHAVPAELHHHQISSAAICVLGSPGHFATQQRGGGVLYVPQRARTYSLSFSHVRPLIIYSFYTRHSCQSGLWLRHTAYRSIHSAFGQIFHASTAVKSRCHVNYQLALRFSKA